MFCGIGHSHLALINQQIALLHVLSVEADGGNGKGQLRHVEFFEDSVAAAKSASRVVNAIIQLLFMLCVFHPQVEMVSIWFGKHGWINECGELLPGTSLRLTRVAISKKRLPIRVTLIHGVAINRAVVIVMWMFGGYAKIQLLLGDEVIRIGRDNPSACFFMLNQE